MLELLGILLGGLAGLAVSLAVVLPVELIAKRRKIYLGWFF